MLKGCNTRCGFGNIYAPNDDAEWCAFLKELQGLIKEEVMPWCLCGDFNVVKSKAEKIRLSFNQATMDAFSNFIEELELIDLPFSGAQSERYEGAIKRWIQQREGYDPFRIEEVEKEIRDVELAVYNGNSWESIRWSLVGREHFYGICIEQKSVCGNRNLGRNGFKKEIRIQPTFTLQPT
ncbi:hypothetical protein PTKIN_Ptkin15bG0019000 [Pterospermum kingtungense]